MKAFNTRINFELRVWDVSKRKDKSKKTAVFFPRQSNIAGDGADKEKTVMQSGSTESTTVQPSISSHLQHVLDSFI